MNAKLLTRSHQTGLFFLFDATRTSKLCRLASKIIERTKEKNIRSRHVDSHVDISSCLGHITSPKDEMSTKIAVQYIHLHTCTYLILPSN